MQHMDHHQQNGERLGPKAALCFTAICGYLFLFSFSTSSFLTSLLSTFLQTDFSSFVAPEVGTYGTYLKQNSDNYNEKK